MRGHFRDDDIGPNEPPADVPDAEAEIERLRAELADCKAELHGCRVMLAAEQTDSAELERVRGERDRAVWALYEAIGDVRDAVEAIDGPAIPPGGIAAALAEHDARAAEGRG